MRRRGPAAWVATGALAVLAAAVMIVLLARGLATPVAGKPDVSPNEPTGAELVERWESWDGRQVTFTGEVIGDLMHRGDGAWIHLNDDAYYLRNIEEGAPLGGYNSGHAVWLPAALAERVSYAGRYAYQGDVVAVEGVFNAACAAHGGDMDIHASDLAVISTGHSVIDPIEDAKFVWAVVLSVLAALLWSIERRTRRGPLRLRPRSAA